MKDALYRREQREADDPLKQRLDRDINNSGTKRRTRARRTTYVRVWECKITQPK